MATGPPETHALPAKHANGSEEIWQRIRQDLSGILKVLEGRFLYLIKESGRGGIPPDTVVSELSFLSRDLRAGFRRLAEVEERRDLSFDATQELVQMDRHCTWLFRKIGLQQIFLRKLTLEANLRNLISAEAFAIYQSLLSLDDEEHETLSTSDAQIRARLLKE